jgi:hypothetical protein
MTEGGDIGFRVYYKSAEDGTVDLIPTSRVESHLVTEECDFICVKPGKCMYFEVHQEIELQVLIFHFLFRRCDV